MFQHILVPLDGSHFAERALPVAAMLAHATGGVVILLHAIDAHPARLGPHPVLNDRVSTRKYLDHLARSETLAGIHTEIALFTGEATQAILSCTQSNVDLVVMTSHTGGGNERWMRGSIAEQVVRQASVPVMVLPNTQPLPVTFRPEKMSELLLS